MLANKIFIDLWSTGRIDGSYENYRKWYEENDNVGILLLDCNIYTIVKRKEMFTKNMHHGCFIDHISCDTPAEVQDTIIDWAVNRKLKYVEPNKFIKLERKHQDERIRVAFKYAEKLIAQD